MDNVVVHEHPFQGTGFSERLGFRRIVWQFCFPIHNLIKCCPGGTPRSIASSFGAIGASGVQSQDDEKISQAGVSALE
jgi:uncharacterized protein GlcG (DUF336 family)